MATVLYNPLSNNKKGQSALNQIKEILKTEELKEIDVTTLSSYQDLFSTLPADETVILCGGDGTLNIFVNSVYELQPVQKIYYFPSGSGNDFANDVADYEKFQEKLIPLNQFMKSLPMVKVNGISKRFINGIGYGIDGYCCEAGDDVRKKSDKKVNYTSIAIKGLLGKYHPVNAKVTVDGVTKEFKKVWLAPAMIGKFYGGGMMIAPAQNRLNEEKTLTSVIWCGCGRLKTLMLFSSIFTGEHVKYPYVDIRTGKEITVEFDSPQALQIDGETVRNVTTYTVTYN